MSKLAKRLAEIRAKGPLYRVADVGGVNLEERTVELSFSSELEYQRWFGIEILSHEPGHARLDRLNDKAALLWNHNWDDMRGVVESARVDGDRKGRAIVRLSKSPEGEKLLQDVADGIVTKVSVGYLVHGIKLLEEREDVAVYLVDDWEGYEISFVSVPADPTVGVGRSMENPQEEHSATDTQTDGDPTGGATTEFLPEETRHMKIKNVRDANGNLVRAEVDDNDSILKVLEVIEEAGADVRAAQKRGAEAANARITTIIEMGELYDCRDLAAKAIKDDTTVDQFRQIALDHLNGRGTGKATPAGGGERSGSKPISEMPGANIGLTDKEVRQFSVFRAVRALQPNASEADKKAAAFEFECSEAAQKQLGRSAQGILIPQDVLESRAFNAGGAANSPTGATSGANVVATELLSGSFIDMLRNRTTIMRLARTMGGLVGNVDIPKQTAGATAYWLGEGADATEGTPTIGQIELSPKTVAAYTDITRRLLMQSTPDAEGIVRGDLVAAIAQAIDYAGYYGSGASNQPRGIKNYAGINAKDFAATQPTYAELVEMETLIAADNADVNNMAYVLNATGRGALKTTQKFSGTNGAPVWEDGNTVNGYRTEVTNQVATGDYFFGNFGDMIVGLWGGLDLTVDPYSLSKSGGIRIVVFQDVDFVLRRLESFCWGSASVS